MNSTELRLIYRRDVFKIISRDTARSMRVSQVGRGRTSVKWDELMNYHDFFAQDFIEK